MSKNQPSLTARKVGLALRICFVCLRLETVVRSLESLLLIGLVGVTGLEPVTLRLSSACSNQLSYRPDQIVRRSSIRVGGAEEIRTPDL